jgi:hypothetical protein
MDLSTCSFERSEVGVVEDLLDTFDGLSLRELRRHVVLRLWSGF